MERGACERRALKQIKIGNPYSQICFPNFVGEKEEKSLNRTYYCVPYNRGLYGNLFLVGDQLYHLPFFFPQGCESQAPPANRNSSTNFTGGQLYHSPYFFL